MPPENSYRGLPATTGPASHPELSKRPTAPACINIHGETESRQGTSLAQGHPGSPRAPRFPNAKATPCACHPPYAGKHFLPPAQLSLLRPGVMSLEASQKVGEEVYLAPVTQLEGSCLNVRLGRPGCMPVTTKEKPVFPLAPHTPQGRNPARGSEFHENEPQSLHRWIQISQLHISASSPLPLLPTTAPGPNLPPACPSLHLLAQQLSRFSRGACWIRAHTPGNSGGGPPARSGRAEVAIRLWIFPHRTSLPSSPGQRAQGVWLQGDFKIPTLCQGEEEGSHAVGEKSPAPCPSVRPAHCPGPGGRTGLEALKQQKDDLSPPPLEIHNENIPEP